LNVNETIRIKITIFLQIHLITNLIQSDLKFFFNQRYNFYKIEEWL